MTARKYTQWAGIAVFTILGIASIVYYKERVLYVDSAYYAFNFLNKGYPAAEHNRYALWLYQLIPWALLKTGFSIPIILRTYSLCHVLLHAIPFFLLLRMNEIRLAALLLIMQVIGYRECFFLTVNETALAISSTVLLAGCLNYFSILPKSLGRILWHHGIIYLLCVFTALFSHPMAMLLMPFVIVYQMINGRKNTGNKRECLLATALFLTGVLIKILSTESTGYENDLFDQLKNTSNILSGIKEVYSFNFFFGDFKLEAYFFTTYIIPVILLFPWIYRLAGDKKYMELFYGLLAVTGLWLLVVVMFNRGDGNIFMEKNFVPWIFVALFPYTFTSIRFPRTEFALMLCIIVFSMIRIHKVLPMYQKRVWLTDRLITEKNPTRASKLLINDSLIDHNEWMGTWALPYETLLLSKIKGIQNTTAKVYHNDSNTNRELHKTYIFIGADFIPILADSYILNQELFALKQEVYLQIKDP